MGQRHQVYVALPQLSDDSRLVIGLHHQWLFGGLAARLLRNTLKFIQKQGEHGPFTYMNKGAKPPFTALEMLYSFDADLGYFSTSVIRFESNDDVFSDPRLGDNSDGITVIDCRHLMPDGTGLTYCFMHFDDFEGKPTPEPFVPLSARQYVERYYYAPGSPGMVRAQAHIAGVELLGVPVMSQENLESIFPAMFGKETKKWFKYAGPQAEEKAKKCTSTYTDPDGVYKCSLPLNHEGTHKEKMSDGFVIEEWNDSVPADEEEPECQNFYLGFYCTSTQGHDGDHVAELQNGKVVKSWPHSKSKAAK
jgi:hypothetical protein